MEGNPELQMRNWGREFYLEHSDCEYLFGNAGYFSEGLDVSYDYSTFLRYMNSKMESIPGKRQEMFHL